MKVRLRFFASLREALGPQATLELPGASATVGQVRDALIARGDPWAAALDRARPVRAALERTLCAESAEVPDNAEVAFFPPVTGG